MKLRHDLKVNVVEETAGFLSNRIRKTFADGNGSFSGPVKVNETSWDSRRTCRFLDCKSNTETTDESFEDSLCRRTL